MKHNTPKIVYVDLDKTDELKDLITNHTNLFEKREKDLSFGLKIALYFHGMSVHRRSC